MSDPAPDRNIGGPPPRVRQPEPDLSRLIADRRDQSQIEHAIEPSIVDAQGDLSLPRQKAASTSKRAAAASKRPPVSRPPVSAQSDGATGKNTTYLSEATRNRARAAYRATGDFEGDNSWSDFVEKAIAAEAERRETIYNDGEPYLADGRRLRAGRPLG